MQSLGWELPWEGNCHKSSTKGPLRLHRQSCQSLLKQKGFQWYKVLVEIALNILITHRHDTPKPILSSTITIMSVVLPGGSLPLLQKQKKIFLLSPPTPTLTCTAGHKQLVGSKATASQGLNFCYHWGRAFNANLDSSSDLSQPIIFTSTLFVVMPVKSWSKDYTSVRPQHPRLLLSSLANPNPTHSWKCLVDYTVKGHTFCESGTQSGLPSLSITFSKPLKYFMGPYLCPYQVIEERFCSWDITRVMIDSVWSTAYFLTELYFHNCQQTKSDVPTFPLYRSPRAKRLLEYTLLPQLL